MLLQWRLRGPAGVVGDAGGVARVAAPVVARPAAQEPAGCALCFKKQPKLPHSPARRAPAPATAWQVPGCATLPAITGPVYVKYNSASGLCYAARYEGRDRGVLVQLGQRQVGHLPLGLFDEERRNPPPQL